MIEEVERWKQIAIQKAEMDAVRIDEALCSESESEIVLTEPTELQYLQFILENIDVFRDNPKSLPKLFHKAASNGNVNHTRLLLQPCFGIDPFAGSYSVFRKALSNGSAGVFRLYMEMPDFDIRSVPNLNMKRLTKIIKDKTRYGQINMLPLFSDSYFIPLVRPPLFTAYDRERVILYICDKGDSELLKQYVTPSSIETFSDYGEFLTSASVAEVLLQNERLKKDIFFCRSLVRFCCRSLSAETTISLFSQIRDIRCLVVCLQEVLPSYGEKTKTDTIISFLLHKCLDFEVVYDVYIETLKSHALHIRCISALKRMVTDPLYDFGNRDSILLREYVNKGDVELVALLMESPTVNPSALDNEALLLAIKHKHSAIATVLLQDPRVDPSARDNLALYMAMREGLTKLALTILNDPRVKPNRGVFHAAVVDAKLRGHNLDFMERLALRFA